MSRHLPPYDNDGNDSIDNDLQAIETTMNNMMQGAFGLFFKEFMGSSRNTIFEQPPMTTATTTIFDGRNIHTRQGGVVEQVVEDDEFGGNDFRRLANKRKQNQLLSSGDGENVDSRSSIVTEATTPASEIVRNNTTHEMTDLNSMANATAGSIFNLLFHHAAETPLHPPALPSSQQDIQTTQNNNAEHSNSNNNWSFTSTSQRTTYQPDGTQETIITKKTNGMTETIRRTRYPDGHTEESIETQENNSLWNRLLGR